MSHLYRKPERHTPKLRWMFLVARGSAYSVFAFCLGLSLMGPILALFALCLCLDLAFGRPDPDIGNVPLWASMMFLLPWIVGCIAFQLVCLAGSNKAYTRGKDMRYVPPVRQQNSRLPDKEVLLRGSSEPVAGREELLRAASGRAAETGAELLRAGRKPDPGDVVAAPTVGYSSSSSETIGGVR